MLSKKILLFIVFILISNCSFDSKTGIWGDKKKERERISDIEKNQKEIIDTEKIYSSDEQFNEEVILNKNIILSKANRNSLWKMSNFNYQNFMDNLYLEGIDNVFLKKKVGKDKFTLHKEITQLLVFDNNIIFSDDKGTIYKINESGRVIWKKNIYKKSYKRIYKNLVFSIYENHIYVADNIGLVYSIDLFDGKLKWIKNHEVPIKSSIKVFDDKIFLINQDNRLLSFSTKDGSIIWNVRSASSFIKTQDLLSIAISKQGDVVASTSAGDLYKINSKNGNVSWSLNTLGTLFSDDTDFFKSSDIVIVDENIIFSTQKTILSYNLSTGYMNWMTNVSSIAIPIVDGENIFFVTENGYFVIIDINSGEIISSTNILKILKTGKQNTKITGFIMGSGKIYSVTLNGYIIVSSATSGKVESLKKIGNPITSLPIINNGKLFIYTEKSRILGFN